MLKKSCFLVFTVTLLALLGSINPAFANEIIEEEDVYQYEYEYKGITFTGTTPLSDEHLESLYQSTKVAEEQMQVEDGFGVMSIPGGGNGGTITHGPVRRTFTNATKGEVIDVMIAYIASRVPATISKNFWYNWAFNRFTGWARPGTTYISYWNWRVRDSYPARGYYDYSTIAHHNSTYTQTLAVDYFRVN
ncbi:hypothetical protein BpOF4_21719 (plasmid) [Alkalihalophilus pseudofirmus OF4]|uniref:Uncharacterized protein n=1 Tax=Alkalihalophilus pseudofirmus (strain ATCC BAA-2126 / JCM 17055 / OF4) TaxID=398511 RepID=D3G1W3_ALKPO|nr:MULTISPECIES: hypothetical protein [Alkalihalophilus]ADC52339.1 hypothetical protein BpOF4_21719 [Alkalihalophilus pseudofirmus OF4]MED1602960.1 hypothetical protein [Alkalihalophilus marmarensis]